LINAVIVRDIRPGQPVVQPDPIDSNQPSPLRQPADHTAFDKIHAAVRDAMRISTGQDEPKAAAKILRKRATAAAKGRKQNPPARRTTPATAAPSRPPDLKTKYKKARGRVRRVSRKSCRKPTRAAAVHNRWSVRRRLLCVARTVPDRRRRPSVPGAPDSRPRPRRRTSARFAVANTSFSKYC
jgi:hypothetical protein